MHDAFAEKRQGRDDVSEMVPVNLIDNLRLACRAVSKTRAIDRLDADLEGLARAAFELTAAVDERKAKCDAAIADLKAAERCAQAAIDFIGQFRHDFGLRADGEIKRDDAASSGPAFAVEHAFSKVFPHDELRSVPGGGFEIKISVTRVTGTDGGYLPSSEQVLLRSAVFDRKAFERS